METGKKQILIVDDSISALKAIASELDEQFEIVTANSGYEAMELLAQSFCRERTNIDIRLIITDLRMPEMNGLELA